MSELIRILYIDDSAADRELVCDTLEKEHQGFKVVQTASREEFEARLAEDEYDVVLSDFNILGFEGLDVIDLVVKKSPHVPVIIVTGTGSELIAVKAMKRGAADYVIKTPIHIRRLPFTIQAALEKVRLKAEGDLTEELLNVERDRLKSVFKAMIDGIHIVDQEYDIEYVNDVLIAEFGPYEGRKCYAYFHDREDVCPWCRSPEVFAGKTVRWDWTSPRNGKAYDMIDMPLKNTDGSISKLEIFRDISDRKQIELALSKNEEKYRALYENAPLSYQSLDEDGCFLDINPNWLKTLGYSKEEVIGRNYAEFLHPDWKPHFEKNFPEFKKRGYVHDVQFKIRHKDGHFLDISFEGCIGYLPDGSFRQTYCVFQDITEQKRTEKKIKHLNLILRTIRNISRLITEEKNRDALIHKVCEILIENHGYFNAWIVLLGQQGEYLGSTEAGLGESFAPMRKILKEGKLTDCGIKTLKKKDIAVINNVDKNCADCPLASGYKGRGGYSICLSHGDIIYGLLTVSVAQPFVKDKEGQDLFREVGADIGFALHSIEVEEKRSQAEEALLKNQYYLFKAQEIGTIGTWELNIQENILIWTDENYKIFGVPPGTKLNYQIFLNCIHPDDRDYVNEKWSSGLNHEPYDIEHRIIVNDEVRWVREKADIEFDTEGTAIMAIGFTQDITERKQMEEELSKERTLQRAIIDNIPVLLTRYDPNANVLFLNKAFEKTVGWKTEEIKDIDLMEKVYPDPDYRKQAMEYMQKAGTEWRSFRLQSKSGEIIDAEWSNVHLDDGTQIGIGIDITERKKAEAERELLISAIEQGAETVMITDTEGKIEYVNPAFERITGYSREEAIGQYPQVLYRGEQDEAFYREMWGTLKRGETWSGRFVNRRKDGTIYTEEAVISPVRDASGATVNYVSVKRDITQEILLEDQLLHSQKMEAIGKLAGGVAHDFNNMLGVIMGYTEMARAQIDPSHSICHNLDAIQKAAERSADLTRQLLAFSRKLPLEPKVLNLNDLLKNLEEMLRRVIGEDILLTAAYAGNVDLVEADPGQIEQIVMNLAVNARDAMPGGGRMTIETANVDLNEQQALKYLDTAPGSYVMVALSDTGCGMEEEIRSKIFEPFFTTKETGKGTGLGLSTVYGIVKQSGGHILCESEPDKGTTFRVYLPRTAARPVHEAEQDEAPVKTGDEEHILVVEDETHVRDMLERSLSKLHYRVTVDENGEEALHLIEEKGLCPALIITDVVMPGMNGILMIKRARQKLPGQKVLCMSGYIDDDITHQDTLDPSIPFIQKPFTLHDISTKIKQVLSGKEPHDEEGR